MLCVYWRHITPSNGSVDIATVWKNTTEKHDRRWEIESECRSFSFNEWNSFSERVTIPRRAGSTRELSYSLATRRRRLFFLFAFFSPFKKSFLGGESKKCHQWLKIYDFVVKETNKNGKMFIMRWSKVVKFATSDERDENSPDAHVRLQLFGTLRPEVVNLMSPTWRQTSIVPR